MMPVDKSVPTKIPATDEFLWIMQFIAEMEDYSSEFRHQLRSLWTAFCLHQNIDVDTASYDSFTRELSEAIKSKMAEDEPFQFDAFDLFMGEYLC